MVENGDSRVAKDERMLRAARLDPVRAGSAARDEKSRGLADRDSYREDGCECASLRALGYLCTGAADERRTARGKNRSAGTGEQISELRYCARTHSAARSGPRCSIPPRAVLTRCSR